MYIFHQRAPRLLVVVTIDMLPSKRMLKFSGGSVVGWAGKGGGGGEACPLEGIGGCFVVGC